MDLMDMACLGVVFHRGLMAVNVVAWALVVGVQVVVLGLGEGRRLG